jgi:hypothetical protein
MVKRPAVVRLRMSEFSRHNAAAILACLFVCWPIASPIAADEGSSAPSAQGSSSESRDSVYFPLRGKMTTPDGKPGAGIEIVAQSVSRDGKRTSSKATSGSDGSYSIILGRNQACIIGVVDRDWAAEPRLVDLTEDHMRASVDFALVEGSLFKGVVQGPKDSPMPNQTIVVEWLGNKAKQAGKADNIHFQWTIATDMNGEYSLRLAPGNYRITGPIKEVPRYAQVDRQNELVVDFHIVNGSEYGPLTGKVLDPDGKAVAGATIEGYSVRRASASTSIWTRTDSEGKWKAQHAFVPALVGAVSADGKLVAITRVEAYESEATLHLVPAVEAHGKLLDGKGRPAAHRQLMYGVTVRDDETDLNSSFVFGFGATVTTDDHGRYTLWGLVPGQKYDVEFELVQGGFRRLTTVEPTKAETLEIVDLTMP